MIAPPHSAEAEMAVIGCMILCPAVIPDVLEVIPSPSAFYVEANSTVYKAALAAYDKTGTIDIVLLLSALKDSLEIEAVGGHAYIEKLAVEAPPAVNAVHSAQIVADKYRLRQLLEVTTTITHEIKHGKTDDVDGIIDAAEARMFAVTQPDAAAKIMPVADIVVRERARLVAIADGSGSSTGIKTGFRDLDRDTGGVHPGEFVIVAARPSMGKTALALNLAEQIALGTDEPGVAASQASRPQVPIGVFSIEMSADSLVQRMTSAWSGLSSQSIRAGALTPDEMNLVTAALAQISQAPLYIDDSATVTLTTLKARARRMVAQHSVRAIVIDYLQLMTAPDKAKESRQVEVSSISRGIKALARELGIPIIGLCQLNRGPEGREGNRPRLSDLRESGSLEQDADVVLLLHREEYYHIQDPSWASSNPDKVGTADLIIAKQRNGPTNIVTLDWDARTTRFKNQPLTHASQARSIPSNVFGTPPRPKATEEDFPF
jgi:replicative DNA helicase